MPRRFIRRSLPVPFVLALVLSGISFAAGADSSVSFNRDIRPILSDNCFYCHGFDPKNRKADLRLDTPEGATAEHDGSRAIEPGDLAHSELWERINSDDKDEMMPPPKAHKTVTAAQKETLKRWIEQGAKYQSHWSFIPVAPVDAPAVKRADWPRNEIDRFILARLENESLRPSPEASKATLIRRVTLDLTGLPPTLEEVQAFAADDSPQAYERVVDRLLRSPRFGERMAVDWMDAARYADTHGFNNDSARSMWRWRDWVIDAFNSNKPYDRFIVEQLAGDLLPQSTLDQRIATGFCRNHVINSEGGIIQEEYRVEYVADRVRTMSTAWLGLTMECVRCHDHKFDPLTQKDYYGMFAFFNSVPEHGEDGRVANAVPIMPAPTREQQQEIAAQRERLRGLEARLTARRETWKEGSASRSELAVGSVETSALSLKIRLQCDDSLSAKDGYRFPKEMPELVDGIVGKAWSSKGRGPLAELAKGALDFGKPLAVTLWLRPDEANPRDVALLSNVSYSGSPDAQGYGRGQELRLIDGEIEVRINGYFPAYAMRMRSEGAAIRRGQWRHVAVDFGPANRRAADIRIFADGRELPTRILYDGTHDRAGGGAPFNLGADRSTDATAFIGSVDEVRVYEGEFGDARVAELFFSQAVPYAQRQVSAGIASELERDWLREARQCAGDAEYANLIHERDEAWGKHLAFLRSLPTTMVMEELSKPRPTYVLKRGAYDAHGDEVTADAPALIAPWPEGAPRNRLGLALWLTQPQHPLTARVVVNRFWAQLFGTGLVKTLEDFGSQGEYPSHPELLDWLAQRFVNSGWDVKALLRTIVLSATYRQSSRATPELLARDPENRLLARAPRLRLPAEFLRDQALALSGLLREHVGGPSVFPYQPAGLYDGLVVGADYPGTKWTESTGDDLFRRSLYTFWKRTVPHPAMITFDAPDREVCTVRRARTNTPLQALVLMNEPAFDEAARRLGERMQAEGGADDQARLRWGFHLVTARDPGPEEMRELGRALDDARRHKTANVYGVVGSILLNLDETITRE
jgi:hypothetical protein